MREPRALVRGGCGLRRRARSRADLSYVNTTNGFGITKRSSGSSSGCSGRRHAAAVASPEAVFASPKAAGVYLVKYGFQPLVVD